MVSAEGSYHMSSAHELNKYADQSEYDLRILLHFYEGLHTFDRESEAIKAELGRRPQQEAYEKPVQHPTSAERGKLAGHWLPEDVLTFGFTNASECLKHIELQYADAKLFIQGLRETGEETQAKEREAYWNALMKEARESLGDI